MIDKILKFLAQELDVFLAGRFPAGGQEERVRLSGLSLPSGDPPPGLDNKVVLSLLNLERENAAPVSTTTRRTDGGFDRHAPPLHLNLQLLASASFANDYTQGLARLSAVLGFFQGRHSFTPETAPGLPPNVERLTVEFLPLSLGEMSNLWTTLGAKYMPCAVYRVRMVTIQQGWMLEAEPQVVATDGRVGT